MIQKHVSKSGLYVHTTKLRFRALRHGSILENILNYVMYVAWDRVLVRDFASVLEETVAL